MGFQEFVPHNGLVSRLSRMICEIQATSSIICSNALFLISGYDSQQLDTVWKNILLKQTIVLNIILKEN